MHTSQVYKAASLPLQAGVAASHTIAEDTAACPCSCVDCSMYAGMCQSLQLGDAVPLTDSSSLSTVAQLICPRYLSLPAVAGPCQQVICMLSCPAVNSVRLWQ